MMVGPETSTMEPLAPLIPPDAGMPANTQGPTSADLVQGQQQASGAYRLDPNYRPQMAPQQQMGLKPSQWLGNGQVNESRASGGDYIAAATMPVPTFQIDNQIADVRKQKAELNEWISKQGEQFKGKAADPYQPAYEQYVGREQNKMVKDVADMYFGGNMDKAWQGIHDDPELRSQWDQNNRYQAAIGQANRGGYEIYQKTEQDIRDGKLELPPKDVELLNDALDGKWSFNGDTPAHSAWKFEQLNDKISLGQKWKDYFHPNMDKAGDMTIGNNRVITSGGRKFLVTDTKKDYDQFVDQFAKQAMKDGPWRDEAEVREFAESMVGRMSKEEWKELRAPKSSSGSGGGSAEEPKTVVGEVEVGLSANYPDNTPTKNPTPVYRVPIARVVGGKPELMAKKDFRDGSGAAVALTPTHLSLSDLDGKLYIEGVGDAKDDTNPDADYGAEGEATVNKVPYIGNEKTFELFVGREQAESAKAKAFSARESDPMRKRAGTPKKAAGKTIAFDMVKSKVPTFTKADYDEAMKSEEGRQMLSEMFK